MQRAGKRTVQNIFDQRTFAGAADAGNCGERAEGDANVEVAEVVVASAEDFEEMGNGEWGMPVFFATCSFRFLFFPPPLTVLVGPSDTALCRKRSPFPTPHS